MGPEQDRYELRFVLMVPDVLDGHFVTIARAFCQYVGLMH